MKNALTVDVEDWFQVSNFAHLIKKCDWDSLPSHVEANTRRLLDLFDEYGACGTFFVLGWVADRFPGLVEQIRSRGHDLACHGYGHDLVYDLGKEDFAEDLERAISAIEGAAGIRPRGYRAPSFSIDHRSLWAFDVLSEKGFGYDSSVYPVNHPRYGIPSFARFPRRVRTRAGNVIREFPLTTWRVLGRNVGASGGGYLRIFPLGVLRAAFRQMNRAGHPAVLYIHPWEIDCEQPRLRIGGLGRFTHYRNLHATEGRLKALLQEFSFTTMEDALRAAPDLTEAPIEVG